MADVEKTQRRNPDGQEKSFWQKGFLLYLHDLICMLAGIMLVFMLLFRMVIVDGSSMYPTLWHGDWLLVLSGTFYQEPEYGDIIVVCKESFNDGEAIIKRVIATEGQKVDIDFEAGIVYVDDAPLQEDYTYTLTNLSEGMVFPQVVDDGCVFAMGDNRNGSRDSRDPMIGMIDRREILGKALFLMYPGSSEGNTYAPIDLSRIGVLNDGR